MASPTTGYVTVYESSDGGTGDPAQTLWQFFVGTKAVTTKNHYLAETARLAISTNSQVQAAYDNKNVLSQLRIEFEYACETRRVDKCKEQPTN